MPVSEVTRSTAPGRLGTNKMTADMRDIMQTCEKLRKEVERKDAKLETLIKESQGVRSTHAAQLVGYV